jgi:hypothetical protein
VEVLKVLDHGTPTGRKKPAKAKAKPKPKARTASISDHVAWMLVPTPLQDLAEQRMRLAAAPRRARRKPGK